MTDTTVAQSVALPDGTLLEVAEGVFAWIQPDGTWWINNAGFISDRLGVAIIDTCTTEKRTRHFLDLVEENAPGIPVKFAVNTHHHGDHTFGNSLLPERTCLIGHARMRAAFLEDTTLENFPAFWSPKPNFGTLTRRAPDLTIEQSASFYLGQQRIDVVHPGYTAHTDGDVAVWIPAQRVLFVGDLLFPGHTPMIMAGAPSGAIRSLRWIADFKADVIIPGHGPVIHAADLPAILDEHESYYRFVLAEAQRGQREHLSPLGVAQSADISRFAHLMDTERFVLNVHSAYAEIAGGIVHRPSALADAVAWTGRPIPTRV